MGEVHEVYSAVRKSSDFGIAGNSSKVARRIRGLRSLSSEGFWNPVRLSKKQFAPVCWTVQLKAATSDLSGTIDTYMAGKPCAAIRDSSQAACKETAGLFVTHVTVGIPAVLEQAGSSDLPASNSSV